jgi:hypothetical protein
VDVLGTARPSIAAYLKNVESAELLPTGVLRLVLPAAKNLYEARLNQPTAREAILGAAQQVTGRNARALELAPGDASDAAPGSAPLSRKEILDRAREDPLVQALFDRFGAVVLNGQALTPDDEQE